MRNASSPVGNCTLVETLLVLKPENKSLLFPHVCVYNISVSIIFLYPKYFSVYDICIYDISASVISRPAGQLRCSPIPILGRGSEQITPAPSMQDSRHQDELKKKDQSSLYNRNLLNNSDLLTREDND